MPGRHRRLRHDRRVRLGVDLLERSLSGQHLRLPVGVRCPRSWNSGITSAANSSRLADVLVAVLARLVEQDDLVDVGLLELAQLARIVSGEPMSPAALRLLPGSGSAFHSWYSSHRSAPGAGLDRAVPCSSAARTGRTSSRRPCAGASSSVGAHMKPTTGDVRVAGVVGELLEPLGERRCSRRAPRPGRLGATRTGSRARPCPSSAGHLDGLELEQATHSGGCGFWSGLGMTLRSGEVEVLAVVLPALLPEHRQDARTASSHTARLSRKRRSNGCSSVTLPPLADAELDPAVAEQVERGDPLGDAGRVVGGELDDAVAEPDVLRALAGGGEEDLGRRGVEYSSRKWCSTSQA